MLMVVMRTVLQQQHSSDACDALCDLLVSFAPSHMHAIQDTLLDMFEPGCPPHPTVLAALESLCNSVPLLVPAPTLQRVRSPPVPPSPSVVELTCRCCTASRLSSPH